MLALVGIGQRWTDRAGRVWRVRQVHRKDRQVELVIEHVRLVSFEELGRDYRQAL